MNERLCAAGAVGLLAALVACGSPSEQDDDIMTSRDGGTAAPRDGGTPDSGVDPDPCGPYAHDVNGACTSSVAWTQGPSIDGARDHHATTLQHFADGPYLLVSGGGRDSFSEFFDDVQRIKLSEDGRPIGEWEEIGTLPGQLAGHTMNIHNGRMYITGGATRAGRFDTVISARISSLGELGDWRNEPSMPVSVWHHQAFIREGSLYVVGGQSGNEIAENKVQRAEINADGTLAPWEALTELPAVRSHHGSVATDDAIFVLGGLEDSEFRAEVLRAPFSADGTIGDWENVGLIPGTGLVTPSVGLLDNRIFAIAGLTGDLEFVGTVLSMPIHEDGSVGAMEVTPEPLPEGRGHVHQMPMLNGRFFVVAGRSGESAGIGRFRSLDTLWVGTVR